MERFITKESNRTPKKVMKLNFLKFEMKNSLIDLETYNSISELLLSHSVYISTYIQLLNKYINLIKKASSLKNERNLLIKFVKKLRFFNNYYYFKELIYVPENLDHSVFKILQTSFIESSSNLQELQSEKDLLQQITIENFQNENFKSKVTLETILTRVVLSNNKLLEVIEILNFVITNTLKNEVMSKTLNENLTISDNLNKTMSHVYCIFVKFNQWITEALKLENSNGNMDNELLELVLRNETNNTGNNILSEDDELLLQEIDECQNVGEFNQIVWQWCDIIRNLLRKFDEDITKSLNLNGISSTTNNNNDNQTFDQEIKNELKINLPKRNLSITKTNSNNNSRRTSTSNRHSRYGSANTRATSANSSFH
ncbi:hypothetical protein QEN19_002814 [Hanseniaspora menglaensis]